MCQQENKLVADLIIRRVNEFILFLFERMSLELSHSKLKQCLSRQYLFELIFYFWWTKAAKTW